MLKKPSAGQFKVIVKSAYSSETDEALFDNPHVRASLKVLQHG
jgi:hypothetical protein